MEATPPTGRQPGMAFILAIVFLDMVGLGVAIPVGPQLIASFVGNDLSRASIYVGLLGALYTGTMFLFAPLLGALSDRFGRKPVLLVALAASVASYVSVYFAPSLWVMLIGRGLGGLGGASMTVAQTYIADVSSHEDRAKNFGMVGAAFGFGFIVGPAIGGWLGGYGMRVPFLVAGLISLASLLYGALVLPESHKLENRRAFRWQEANPMGWIVTMRRHPEVQGFAIAMIWIWLGHQCLQNTWVLYTSLRFGWQPADNGMSLAAVGITSVIVQGFLIGKLVPMLGERRAILGGLVWGAFALAGYGLATQGWMMYVLIAVASLGSIAGPTLQGHVSKLVGPQEQGAVQGALTSLTSLTGIVGPLIANNLFAYFTSPAAPVQVPGAAFFLGGACTLVGAILAWRLLAREVSDTPVQQPA
ncbi:MAG: tetracycline resistance efflux pump [Cyanobacteria bacterium RYN_339]|nr:tetracycline resistance efflux pump [Cyanobacteria bacterium RYN_339]